MKDEKSHDERSTAVRPVYKPRYYYLRGKEIMSTQDPMKWEREFRRYGNRVVGRTIVGGSEVSTVFLGIDHGFTSSGPPILFETMVFGGKHDDYTMRYATWEEAEKGHAEVVAMVRGER